MEAIRWIIGCVLLLFFAGSAITNAAVAHQIYIKRKSASFILFVGGIAGTAGLLLIPLNGSNEFWWLPPILDVGTGPVLVFLRLLGLLPLQQNVDDKP